MLFRMKPTTRFMFGFNINDSVIERIIDLELKMSVKTTTETSQKYDVSVRNGKRRLLDKMFGEIDENKTLYGKYMIDNGFAGMNLIIYTDRSYQLFFLGSGRPIIALEKGELILIRTKSDDLS
jgi:hypothetical protein